MENITMAGAAKDKAGVTPESGGAAEAKPAKDQDPGHEPEAGSMAARLVERNVQTKYDRANESIEEDYFAEAQGTVDERVPSAIDGDGPGIRTVGNLRVFPDGSSVELESGSAAVKDSERKGKDGDPKKIVERNKARLERRKHWSRALAHGANVDAETGESVSGDDQ